MKFVAYIRVSTKKQGRSNLGLEAQKKMCQDHVERQGGEIVQFFEDVESGTHRDRPGLWSAIDCCKANGYTLVIAKLDRLARDVEFTFKVMNTGIQIQFTDMPLINTMVLGVFAAVAQYERELCSSRTKAALAEVKQDINKNGGHMSQSGRWCRRLGRAKGAKMPGVGAASGIASIRRADAWREKSALYTMVSDELAIGTPQKDILAKAIRLYEKNPDKYGTREGKPLCWGTLSKWAKEIRIGI